MGGEEEMGGSQGRGRRGRERKVGWRDGRVGREEGMGGSLGRGREGEVSQGTGKLGFRII